jgi:hypothetical protein
MPCLVLQLSAVRHDKEFVRKLHAYFKIFKRTYLVKLIINRASTYGLMVHKLYPKVKNPNDT